MEEFSFTFNDPNIKVLASDRIVLLMVMLPPFIILFLFSVGNKLAVNIM